MSIKFNINVSKGKYGGQWSKDLTEVKITTGSFKNRSRLEEIFSSGASTLDINECRFQKDGVDIKRVDINDFINKYLDFNYIEHRNFAKLETYTQRRWLKQIVAAEHNLYFVEL